jgi:hypothetical protein
VTKIKELKRAIKLERGLVDQLIADCSESDSEVVRLRKENENLRSALKVIYTWANVERHELNHEDVMSLITRTFGE